MNEWYYALNGAQEGPVAQAVLMQLLSSGQVPADSLVWREGMGDWVAASTVPELAGSVSQSTVQSGVQPVLAYGVADSAYLPGDMQARYAGFGIRFAAAFIDGIVTGIGGAMINGVLGQVVQSMASAGGQSVLYATMGLSFVSGATVGWLYFALMHSSKNQASLGMMACGLRITDLEGRRITFGRATGRFFACYFEILTLWIGYLMITWTARKQALHDIVAGTLVLRK